MNKTTSSAPKSPSQPASEDYNEVVRKLEMECIVARDEFVNSIKMHADLLRKMGNPNLYTKLLKAIKTQASESTPPSVMKIIRPTLYQIIQDLSKTNNYEFLSQPEIQNNIRGYAKNMDGFLRDFKDLPLDKCEQLLRKATLCDHNRDMLMRKEEEALDLYESLMKERDPYSHSDPDVKGLDEKYVREALDFIEVQGKTLAKIIDGYKSKQQIFPFTASVISLSKASDNYMRMLGPTSHSYSEIKQAFSRFSDKFKDPELSEIQPDLFDLTQDERLSDDKKAGYKEKFEATALKDSKGTDSNKKRIDNTVEDIYTRGSTVKTTLTKLQGIQKDILDTSRISYESYQEAKRESRAKSQESKDSSKRVDIEPGDLRAKKVFSAFVTEETVGPLFYNIFGNQSKLAEMLFFKCPVNSKGELIAVRSGKTPATAMDDLEKIKQGSNIAYTDKLATLYTEATKTTPWGEYMRICMPMFRPHGLDTDISEYPFPRTGESDTAKKYLYDFEDPAKSFWVNPYTDDKRSLSTVFCFLRNKHRLLTALRNLKSHQRVRTSTSILDRFNPVAKLLDSEKLDIYQGLQELGYGSAEKFMELSDPHKFALVADKLRLDESEKTRLKDAITKMTETRKTDAEQKQKEAEEKTKAHEEDTQQAKEAGKSVGILGTLKDVFFPTKDEQKTGEGEQPGQPGREGQPSQMSDISGHLSGSKDTPQAPDIHQAKEYLQLKQEYDELKQKTQQEMNELQEQATIANKAIQYQRDKDSQVKYNKERRLDKSEFDLIRKMSHGSHGDTNLKRIIEDTLTRSKTAETLGYVQKQRNTEDMTELKKHNLEQQLKLKKQEVTILELEEAEALRKKNKIDSEQTLEKLEDKLSIYEQQMKRLKLKHSNKAQEMKEDLAAKSKRLRDTTHDLLELQSEISHVRKLKTIGDPYENPPIYQEVKAPKKAKKRTRKKRGNKKTHKQKSKGR